MKNELISFLVVSLLSVGVVFAADPADNSPKLKIGATAGYAVGGDLQENSFVPGVQAVFALDNILSVECAGSILSDNENEEVDILGGTLKMDMNMDVSIFTISGRIAPPLFAKMKNLRFYALGGAGLYLAESDMTVDANGVGSVYGISGLTTTVAVDIDHDPAIGFHFGAGAEYEIMKHLELFADARYIILDLKAEMTETVTVSVPGTTPLKQTTHTDLEGSFNHGVVRAGVNYVF